MIKYIAICILCLSNLLLMAQENDADSLNAENKFNTIRKLAFDGQYEKSRFQAFELLKEEPEYNDVTLLIARTYLWEQKYDSAQVYIDKVLETDPDNLEAKVAQLDLAYFSENMRDVQNLATPLVKQYPDSISYREKLAVALNTMENKTDAITQADSILTLDSLNHIALGIKNQLNPAPPYELTLGYSFDHFSDPYKRWWHLYTAGLKKSTPWGSLEGRINVGYLKATSTTTETATEVQAEMESYIHLSKLTYGMLSYGYSPHDYFPKHKAAIEVWQKLPQGFVASLGMRYYYWNEDILIGTASLEKYLGKFWLCLRGYAHFKDIGVTGSAYFTARRYFTNTNYWQVTLGMGAAPDEPFDIKTDLERLNAYSIRALYHRKLNDRWKLNAGLGYAYEEYYNNKYRNRLDGIISFIYSFGK